jgi:hypothetical protein
VLQIQVGPNGSVPRELAPIAALVPSHNASHIDGWGLCAPSVVLVPPSRGREETQQQQRNSHSRTNHEALAPTEIQTQRRDTADGVVALVPPSSSSPLQQQQQQLQPLFMYYECAAFLTDRPTGDVFTGFCQVRLFLFAIFLSRLDNCPPPPHTHTHAHTTTTTTTASRLHSLPLSQPSLPLCSHV